MGKEYECFPITMYTNCSGIGTLVFIWPTSTWAYETEARGGNKLLANNEVW